MGIVYLPRGPVGYFVYLVFCPIAETGDVGIKVGLSGNPMKRLLGIVSGCPVQADLFAVIECATKEVAKAFEAELLSSFKEWRVHGEWLRVPLSDKARFRGKLIYATRSQPCLSQREWTQMQVQELLNQRRSASAYFRTLYNRRSKKGGRAFRDFERHSSLTH